MAIKWLLSSTDWLTHGGLNLAQGASEQNSKFTDYKNKTDMIRSNGNCQELCRGRETDSVVERIGEKIRIVRVERVRELWMVIWSDQCHFSYNISKPSLLVVQATVDWGVVCFCVELRSSWTGFRFDQFRVLLCTTFYALGQWCKLWSTDGSEMFVLCRAEKQVNGLQNSMDTETDKTVSEDSSDMAAADAGKRLTRRGKLSTAAAPAADKPTAVVPDNSSSDSTEGENDDVVPIMEPRPAKVIAGEVIKQWQTKTRSRGACLSRSVILLTAWFFNLFLPCPKKNFVKKVVSPRLKFCCRTLNPCTFTMIFSTASAQVSMSSLYEYKLETEQCNISDPENKSISRESSWYLWSLNRAHVPPKSFHVPTLGTRPRGWKTGPYRMLQYNLSDYSDFFNCWLIDKSGHGLASSTSPMLLANGLFRGLKVKPVILHSLIHFQGQVFVSK